MDVTLQIFDIKERPTGEADPPSFPTPPSSTISGFPAPKKRTSAFKQRRQAQSGTETPNTVRSYGGRPAQRSTATTEDPEAAERRRINEENRVRLASMSPEEIMEAQKELFSGLDPSILQMLLRRANLDDNPRGHDIFDTPSALAETAPKNQPPEIKVQNTSIKAEPPTGSKLDTTKSEPEKLKKTVTFDEDAAPSTPPPDLFPISSPPPKPTAHTHKHQHADGDTHFPAAAQPDDLDPTDPDFLEKLHKKFFPSTPADPSKLAWMAPLPTEHSTADRESPYYPGQDSFVVSALRFDFRGVLLTPRNSREIPVTEGLHHHGEAPEAAGYTIRELARLARSAVAAQRCIAYQTLGRILYRLGRGDWGAGAGGRDGDEDDLAFALWRLIREGKVLESLEEEASKEEGTTHYSARAYAVEALWLFEKGGWREKWRGL